jgi:hypothetical protein
MIPTQNFEYLPDVELPPGLVVLSVGHGDSKFSFDPNDPDGLETAKLAVDDMLKRGYMLFVESPDGPLRVKAFDPEKCEYIIRIDKRSKVYRDSQGKPPRTWKKGRRVSARTTRATAIAPTAGG